MPPGAVPPPFPGTQPPRKKRIGLVVGVSVGAVALVAALVAGVVFLPGLLGSQEYAVTDVDDGPSMPATPTQKWTGTRYPQVPGSVNKEDAGLLVHTDTAASSGTVEIAVTESATGRELWRRAVPGERCAIGIPGRLTCLIGATVVEYDLRTGDKLAERLLAASPGGRDATVTLSPQRNRDVIVMSVPRDKGGTTTLARYDSEGATVWSTQLAANDLVLLQVHGNLAVVERYDSAGATPAQRWARSVRRLSDGQPVPGLPDWVQVVLLPGGQLMVGASGTTTVRDGNGRTIRTLPAAHQPNDLAWPPGGDDSIHLYPTQDGAAPARVWTKDGEEVSVPPGFVYLGACNKTGVLVESRTDGPDRIGVDAQARQQWRVTLPKGTRAMTPACDGTRFIEAITTRPDQVTLVAYDGKSVVWTRPVSMPGADKTYAVYTAEGIIVYGYDANSKPVGAALLR